MKRKILLLICLILFIVSIAGVSASDDVNQTIGDDTLSVSVNEDIIESTNRGTFSDLQMLIDNSDVESTITLEKDYVYDNATDDSSILIDKALTINGNGHTVQGDKSKGLFYIYNSDVILNNISLIDSNSYSGGAVFSSGNLEVNNCTFINNNQYGEDETYHYQHLNGGGAIFCSGSLSVSGCSFVNCSAKSDGGALYCSDSLSVSGCIFVNCSADWDGGALYCSGSLSVGDCSFVNCSSYDHDGGAIYFKQGTGFVSDCSFVNCSADYCGGAVYGDVPVSSCSFVNCSGYYGGAVYSSGSSVNCNFENCSAYEGGAIYFHKSSNDDVNGSAVDCSFVNCSAWSGGAIYGSSVVNACSFVNCSADGRVYSYGAAIYSEEGHFISDCSFVNCIGALWGGAIDSKKGKFYGTNCSFVNCSPGNFESLDPDYSSVIYLDFNHYLIHILDDIQIIIDVSVKNGTATGDVIVNIDGEEETLTLNDGSVSLVKSNLAGGSHDVYVKYLGDDKFLPSETSSSFIVVEKTFNDLQNVLDNLSDNDILDLDYDYYYCDYLDNGESIKINKTIKINGNGHTINGDYKVSIFNILASTVSLNNISFVNVYSSEYGGVIYSKGEINISDCSFVNCSAGYRGGAVYIGSGSVNNCSFVNCSAAGSGGAVYCSGSVSGCIFVNCSAGYHGGGAIYFHGGSNDVSGCSFVNCSDIAIYSGGNFNLINSSFIGGTWYSSSSVYTFNVLVDGEPYMAPFGFDNSEIILTKDYELISSFDLNANNVVIDGRGHTFTSADFAFVIRGKDVTFKNINFNHTSINSLNENTNIFNCSFVNYYADYGGGAIYFNGGTGFVDDCSFVNCSAGFGGAIYGYDSLSVSNCVFVDCSAWSGGAIYGSGVVNGCSFVNCSAGNIGGAIYSADSVSNCIFVNCSAAGSGGAIYSAGSVSGCSFVNCSAGSDGGAIMSYDLNLHNSSFVVCSAEQCGGAVYSSKGTVDDCSFVNCSAASIGDALYIVNTYSTEPSFSLKDSSFVNGDWYSNYPIKISNVYVDGNLYLDALNDIFEYNARVYLNKDYVLRSGVTVRANNVVIDGRGHTITSSGVVFYIEGVNVTIKNINFNSAKILSTKVNTLIENCNFVNCHASETGGAIYFDKDNCVVNGCSFVNCSVTLSSGGAVYGAGSVSGCSFVNCSAGDGGAIYSHGSVSNCIFVDCHAGEYGGAVYGDGSVSGCSFVNCSAVKDGGAVYWISSVSNCSFVNCSARSGGAIYHAIFVDGSNFMNCSVTLGSGGAIYNAGSVSGCSFVNCSVTLGSGGAICSVDSVSGCNFVNCSVTLGSGGAINIGSGSILNCIFVDCSAGDSGGAIYSEYSTISVSGCSFVDCSANGYGGGAIYSEHGTISVSGCSFVDCSANGYGGAIRCLNLNLFNSSFVDCSPFVSDDMFYYAGNKNSRISSIELTGYFNIENSTFANSYVNLYSNKDDAFISNLTNSIFINGYWDSKYPINVLNYMNISYICYNDSLILNIYPSNFTGDITLVINDKKYTSKINDYSVNFNLKSLNHGIYPAKLIFDGEDIMLPSAIFNLHYSKSFKDLNDLINNAKEGSVIDLTDDYEYYGTMDVNSINITKSITINGNGHTINANQRLLAPVHIGFGPEMDNEQVINKNKVRIFSIDKSNVAFNNISFMNAYSSIGGAIYSSGVLTLNDCNFVNCSATEAGAIYSSGVLTLNDCSFNDCYVICINGFNGCGGAIESKGELFVNDCSFMNCISIWNNGGAIYSIGNSFTILNSIFVNCSAQRRDSCGGAVYGEGSVFNCSFVDCYASAGGSIFLKKDGNLVVNDCSFVNCTSVWWGGAICAGNGNDLSWGNLVVNDCSFVNCSSGGGGAIGGARNLNVTDCSFVNCSARFDGGGAIFSTGNSFTILDCSFVNCFSIITSAWYVVDNYGRELGNGGAVYGTTIYDGSVLNCSFVNCSSRLKGGAVYGDVSVSSCSFVNCSAEYSSGAIYDTRSNYHNFIFNSTFVDCHDAWGLVLYKKSVSDLNVVLNSNILKLGEPLIIDVNLTPKSTGNVKVIIDGKTYTKKLVNSHSQFKISGLEEGTHDIEVLYYEDAIYLYNNITTQVKVGLEEHYLIISAPDVTKTYGGSEKLEITLTNQDSNPVSGIELKITLDGKDYTKTTDNNGKVSLDLDLDSGNYTADILFKGNDEYGKVSATSKIIINKINTETTLSSTKNSQNKVTLTADVTPSSVAGDVIFTVNDEDYTAEINNGKAIYILSNLEAGSYNVKATYKGETNYKASTSNIITFTVEEAKYNVDAADLTKYYHGPERFVVTVKDNDNKPVIGKDVTIYLNGATYTRTTNEKGEASMAINLNSGEYKVTSEFEGIEVESTITVKSTVSGENITKIFRNGTQYYATFYDTSGKTLANNTAVEFNINGVFYTRYTNENGVARMNINLNPGEYIITAKNPNSTEQYTNIITVLPSIVENYDLTKYYKNASQYSLRILDDQGNPVKAGVDVSLNINGVFYTRTSNDEGYVKMNINLEPGEYTITAEYNGLMASNTINVLSVIETKNLDMKYKDGSKFEAKILDGQGNPYPNQKVTFNINGVFYERFTADDGIARLNINLMAGEYIITTSYNGMNAANKVTISS